MATLELIHTFPVIILILYFVFSSTSEVFNFHFDQSPGVINYKRNRSKLGLNHVNYAEISLIRFNGPVSLNSEWTHNNQINGQNYRQRPASLKNSAKQKLNRFESISLSLSDRTDYGSTNCGVFSSWTIKYRISENSFRP